MPENPAPLQTVDGELVGYYDRETRTVDWLVDEPDDLDAIIAPPDVDLREALNVAGPAATIRVEHRKTSAEIFVEGDAEALEGVEDGTNVWNPGATNENLLAGIDEVEAPPGAAAIPDGHLLIPRPPDGTILVALEPGGDVLLVQRRTWALMLERLTHVPTFGEYLRMRLKAWLR